MNEMIFYFLRLLVTCTINGAKASLFSATDEDESMMLKNMTP